MRGIRRDSQLTTQRRLGLLRMLLRGPAHAEALIADLRQLLGDDIYPADARTALRHDMAALREGFDCTIVFHQHEGYRIVDPGMLTLLDLNEPELTALALLFAAIEEGALPQTQALIQLQERLRALLPEQQRLQITQIVPSPRLHTAVAQPRRVTQLIDRLQPMLSKCEITFQYRSPYTAAEVLETHRVAPYELIQREGFTYLEAYCLDSSLTKLRGRTLTYRLDRIEPRSLRRLSRQLPPNRYARRSYRLCYTLAAGIARRQDVPLWFEGSTCSYQPDGSAIVEACITDLWQARQILLRYREHCRVLEPPELIEMMRESAERITLMYRHTVLPPDSEENI